MKDTDKKPLEFDSLSKVALHLRDIFNKDNKKCILLFAHNRTGKTRLSMAFKDIGKNAGAADTLYFNAFTEDLFIWNNDIENDSERHLYLNQESRYFNDLDGLDIENKIRLILHEFADFDFSINYDRWTIHFERITVIDGVKAENIKVSRGEENTFIWCFFLAIAQFAIDAVEEGEPYYWVKHLYVDDPISSLDDNNAISIASNLALKIKNQTRLKVVISTHHTLFFNILCNELGNAAKYFIKNKQGSHPYTLETIEKDAARFYHVAMLQELKNAQNGDVYLYHFNILRILLEKTAAFHGFNDFIECLKTDDIHIESATLKRIVHAKNHGGYSLFEPEPMTEEDKTSFRKILNIFTDNYRFNPKLFPK